MRSVHRQEHASILCGVETLLSRQSDHKCLLELRLNGHCLPTFSEVRVRSDACAFSSSLNRCSHKPCDRAVRSKGLNWAASGT